MGCPDTVLTPNRDFLIDFNRKASLQRIPLSGSIDLTYRCNLRCVHCYLGQQSSCRDRAKSEMGTGRILALLDEIADAGCLHLLFTGGEPLIRDDFGIIYSHAKKKGFLVTVFSNGTMISEAVLGLFEDLPPRAVEVSMYGATTATYEGITGVQGSFEKFLKGITRLHERSIPVRLKTVLMNQNRHEYFSIAGFAGRMGLQFRADAAIFPCLDGDRGPLDLRVPAEDVVAMEFADPERAAAWKQFFERTQGQVLSGALYDCGAGLTSFHVNPYGFLQPCIMAGGIQYDLAKGRFLDGWLGVVADIRQKKGVKTAECGGCEERHLCGYCPPFFGLENGAEDERSEYLCALGRHRLRAIRNMATEGVVYA